MNLSLRLGVAVWLLASPSAFGESTSREPPGEWAINGSAATLHITTVEGPVATHHRLSIGGRSVVWRDGWSAEGTSTSRTLRVPVAAITHPAMVDYTLMLHTHLETMDGKFVLPPLPVRVSWASGGWATVSVMPVLSSNSRLDPSVAHNPRHRVIQWDADLMRPIEVVEVERPADLVQIGDMP